jgi:hypothetical protein
MTWNDNWIATLLASWILTDQVSVHGRDAFSDVHVIHIGLSHSNSIITKYFNILLIVFRFWIRATLIATANTWNLQNRYVHRNAIYERSDCGHGDCLNNVQILRSHHMRNALHDWIFSFPRVALALKTPQRSAAQHPSVENWPWLRRIAHSTMNCAAPTSSS